MKFLLDTQAILLKLKEILDGQKEIIRRLDSLQKSSDLIYHDRELQVETSSNVAGLSDQVLQHTRHVDNLKEDLKVDIADVKNKVESTTEDLKDKIDDKAVIKVKNKSLFKQFKELMKK